MKALAPSLVLAVLIGCQLTVVPDANVDCGPRPTQEVAQADVQVYVERVGLKDPMSAVVRNVRIDGRMTWNNIHGSATGWQVSFELNAKNGFGAYTGFRLRHILVLPDKTIRWRQETDF